MAGRISGITIEIGGDTTKLQTALRGVDSELRTTQSNLKDINKLLKFSPTSTELLTQKQKNLKQAISETKERLTQLKQAQSSVAEGTQEWDALQREIIATEQDLKNLEKQYRQFGSVAAQQIAAVGEKMKTFGQKMSDVGQTLTKYVTLPITAFGTKAVASFAEVDKTLQLVNKTMRNTASEAKLLNDAMSSAAANSVFGMDDAATALLNFARAGLDAEQAAAALAPAMNLAAGEGGNLETVSAGLVGTINGFGDSFNNAAHYADVFAAACNNSALDVDTLSNSMGVAAPVFRTAGRTVEDAALALGIMANANIDANTAANALKTGIMRLADPTKQAATAMKEYGIETSAVWDENGQMRSVLEVQKNLHDSFARLNEQEQLAAASAIFGKNQGAAWLALINTAPDSVNKLSAAIQNSTGVTNEMSDAMMNGFGGSIEKLKSSLDVLMTKIGELLARYLQPVIDKVQGWIDKFNSLDEETQNTIVKIGLIVAAIGPLLLIGGKLITGIGMLMTFAPMLVAAFNPVTLVVLAIAAAIIALIADGVWLVKHWSELKQMASETWENIKQTFANAKEAIVGSIKDFAEAAKQSFKDTWDNIKNTAINTWDQIRDGVANKINAMREAIRTRFEQVVDAVREGVQRLKSIFNFQWHLPHIALPHFWISGTFSLNPPQVPSFGVNWYKKAYDNPLMFTSPTILQTPQGLKGFGDGNGGEVVLGMNKLKELVGAAGDEITINVYASEGMDINKLADAIQDRLVRLNRQRESAYA